MIAEKHDDTLLDVPDDLESFNRMFQERGWGDGLPLIPPTEQFALRRDWSHFSAPAEAPAEAPAAAPVRDASETLPLSQTNAAQPLPAEAAPSLPSAPSATAPAPQARPAQDFKFIGVLGRLYILMENAGGLVLVDQHAAHERILFEEMRRRMEGQGVPTQRLLLPITLLCLDGPEQS